MNRKIDELLKTAFKLNASDIHLTVGVPPIFRVHGDLKRYGDVSIDKQFTESVAQLTIPDKMYPDFVEHGQIDYSYEVAGSGSFSCQCISATRFHITCFSDDTNDNTNN